MIRNKVAKGLLIGGVFCFALSIVYILKLLSPSLFQSKVVFELGILTEPQGKISIQRETKEIKIKSQSKVFSDDRITLGDDAQVNLVVGEERITIFGPADFEIAFPKADEKQVFLNFTQFSRTDSYNEDLQNISLVYNGWHIEPGLGLSEVEISGAKKVTLSEKNFNDESKEAKPLGDREAYLEETIAVKRPQLKQCYENYLRKNPGSKGKLTAHFTLLNTGKVSKSKISDSTFPNDKLFKSCIQSVFRRIKTKKFAGEALSVHYPISFE